MKTKMLGACLVTMLLMAAAPVLASGDQADLSGCGQAGNHLRIIYTSPSDAQATALFGVFIRIFRTTATTVEERAHVRFVEGPGQTADFCVRVHPTEDVAAFVEAIHTDTVLFDSGDFGTLKARYRGHDVTVALQFYNSGVAFQTGSVPGP
jgi:hypothetical protein